MKPDVDVWLASRHISPSVDETYFEGKAFGRNNAIKNIELYTYNADGTKVLNTNSCGVMPIVALRTDISLIGGSGTAEDPYRFNW